MSTPSRKFYDSLGQPPWTEKQVLDAVREHRIRRILPRDQQALCINCPGTLEDPLSIMAKLRAEGIVFDKGDGERLC